MNGEDYLHEITPTLVDGHGKQYLQRGDSREQQS